MASYSKAEEKEFDRQLTRWQKQADKLINDPYYDHVAERLSDTQYSVLCRLTRAQSYKDINVHMWSSGIIQKLLADIKAAIQREKRSGRWFQ